MIRSTLVVTLKLAALPAATADRAAAFFLGRMELRPRRDPGFARRGPGDRVLAGSRLHPVTPVRPSAGPRETSPMGLVLRLSLLTLAALLLITVMATLSRAAPPAAAAEAAVAALR